ncbi:hypothetical protein ACS8FD_20165, partial [Psychrobacter sp. 1U2]
MKRPVLKFASLISTMLLVTTACAEPTVKNSISKSTSQNTSQNAKNTTATGEVGAAIDSQLRQVLTQAGIKTQITSIS